MEYKVILPASSMHNGALQVIWRPSSSTAEDPTNVTANHVFDLSKTREIVIRVGYSASTPYRKVMLTDGKGIINYDLINGWLEFRVVQRLLCPNITSSVNILVLARGCSNMSFQKLVPRIAARNLTTDVTGPLLYPIYPAVYLQGSNGDAEDVTLVPESQPYPVDVSWGEEVRSVRALLQKPSFFPQISSYTPGTTFTLTRGCLGVPIYNSPGSSFCAGFSYQSYYRALFAGWAASERWKFVASDDVAFMIGRGSGAWLTPLYTSNQTYQPDNAVAIAKKGANFAEVHVPFYQQFKYVGQKSATLGSFDSESSYIYGTSINGTPFTPAAFYSWGDDIRASFFAGTPTVVLSSVDFSTAFKPWV